MNAHINTLKAELNDKISTIRNMTQNHPEYTITREQIDVIKDEIARFEIAEANKMAWDKVS